MERFVSGDVVVVPFPFSDLSAAKKRPALILASLKYDDFILCQITSQTKNDGYSIALLEKDFLKGSLKRPSFIRPNRLFTAYRSLILYRVGSIHPAKIKEVIRFLCTILD